MVFSTVFTSTPRPEPSVTPMPDLTGVTDFSTAISGAVGTVLLIVVGVAWLKARAWFSEVTADVKATKVQTTNSHETNMRDDITQALDTLDSLAVTVGNIDARHSAMHEDLRETRKDVRFAIQYTRDVDKRVASRESELSDLIAWGKMRMDARRREERAHGLSD